MARMNRPAPVEVSYKNMRFLITHNPTNATLSTFIEDLKKYGATTVVRVCEVTYDKAPLEKDGITVVDWPFDDGAPPPGKVVEDWLSLLKAKFCDDPGSCVAVHCVAGLGRAPVLVALALIESGMKYEDAIQFIRQRGRSPRSYPLQPFGDKQKPTNLSWHLVHSASAPPGMLTHGVLESCPCDCPLRSWPALVAPVGLSQPPLLGPHGDLQAHCFLVARCSRERRPGWCRGPGATAGTAGADCRGAGAALAPATLQPHPPCVCACDMYPQPRARTVEAVLPPAPLTVGSQGTAVVFSPGQACLPAEPPALRALVSICACRSSGLLRELGVCTCAHTNTHTRAHSFLSVSSLQLCEWAQIPGAAPGRGLGIPIASPHPTPH
uniref:Protein tyrosine phosphatase 4A3 n=1 Tax=Equus asinus TaxID=9793 RepID=A0A9L0IHM7_EQUAS